MEDYKEFAILEQFSDDEINIVCKNADLNLFLGVIRRKKYEKYAKSLGRLDKKSSLVKTVLPRTAFTLYKKGDNEFCKVISQQLYIFRDNFQNIMKKIVDPSVTEAEIKEYDDIAMARFYFRIISVSDMDIPVELFYIFLKLHGISVPEESKISIEKIVDVIREERKNAKEEKVQMATDLNEREKEIALEYEKKKRELKTQLEEKTQVINKLQSRLNNTEQELNKYIAMTQRDRERLEKEWRSKYESEFEEKKTADELKWKQETEEMKKAQEDLIVAMGVEAQQKSLELEENYQKKYEQEEKNFSKKREEYRLKLQEMEEEISSLKVQISELDDKKNKEINYIQTLEETEGKYFESFEQRILSKKIDDLIFEKLGYVKDGNHEKENMPINISTDSEIMIVPGIPLVDHAEYGEEIYSITDFFEDYSDNVSLNFDSATDIASVVLAAVFSGLKIIAADCVCDNLAESMSALLNTCSPLQVEVCSNKYSLKMMVRAINESDSQVVLVKGLLDNYDESLMIRLCELCKGKYLFFSISNLCNLDMFSKNLLNYAVVIDAEKMLHFPEEKSILIGNHDVKAYIPKINLKKCKEIYKKVFNKLAVNNLISKTAGINYTYFLHLYYEMTESDVMGDIIQRSILFACDLTAKEETRNNILKKCGFSIPLLN